MEAEVGRAIRTADSATAQRRLLPCLPSEEDRKRHTNEMSIQAREGVRMERGDEEEIRHARFKKPRLPPAAAAAGERPLSDRSAVVTAVLVMQNSPLPPSILGIRKGLLNGRSDVIKLSVE